MLQHPKRVQHNLIHAATDEAHNSVQIAHRQKIPILVRFIP